MRRLMKGKRRKSENPSDAESEENGGNAHNSNDAEQTRQGGDDDDGESAPKLKRRSVRGRDSNKSGVTDDTAIKNDNDNGSSELINQENGNAGKSSEGIGRKKEERKATTSHDEIESEEEYEVERIVSHRTIKGRRQFLIRWKGYEEDADTWEDESELNCSKLIDDFFTDQEVEQENKNDEKHDESQNSKNDDAIKETDDKLKKTPKKRPRITKRTRKSAKATKKRNNGEKLERDENENDNEKQNAEVEKKTKKLRGSRQQNDNDKKHEENNEDEEKEFEVEKIIDVYFKKNKDREFLIRWKGFPPSDDTWEPEANLNCPDLITKFMNKVEKAKASELRELRTNPSHTKRYTLTMPGQGRRLSRRNAGKERC